MQKLLFISDEQANESEKTEPDLKTLLQRLKPHSGSPQCLAIMRDNIFEDSIAYFKQRNFDFNVPLKITFENEPAIDGGGPVREYPHEICYLLQQLFVYSRDETHAFSLSITPMLFVPTYSRLLAGW